ncbi:MAG: CPBP family intramembrane metalloprotease [Alphaproteobacteria bacterium]|jgi:uncharacterized protein|nr:CPBP family intramembrane metalloprotease [Alphaproteobacteria bacterium]MBT5389164.1 CPBP family intramembrane metalloprotease [Alphaproteobacteria bacterium]MBT5541066.1 CPBP family intramembrane metalloprotease [Alphaproteobacteria bacterium]MBT5654005.1 CPBP family intramembrane metalloprotease [Alphaproteobacteria bacterium]
MINLLSDPFSFVFMLTLGFSALSLWVFPKSKVWSLFLLTATILGYLAYRIELFGTLVIAVSAFVIWCFYKWRSKKLFKIILGALVLIGGGLLYTHHVPGFHNWLIVPGVHLSSDSTAYRLFVNADKILFGLLLVGLGISRVSSVQDWWESIKGAVVPLIALVVLLSAATFYIGYVRFDPKFPTLFFLWAPVNLLFVCVAEEAFFRGFVQKEIAELCGNGIPGKFFALMAASIAYGAISYRGGPVYMVLAGIAGIGYGLAYFKSDKLESSILCHFAFNSIHFLLFSYPALR